jgi:PilZ domain
MLFRAFYPQNNRFGGGKWIWQREPKYPHQICLFERLDADRKLIRRKVPMGVLNFRYRERRRTLRVSLALPLLVHGQNDMGEKFCHKATTRSVNRQGALIVMDEAVQVGQELLLVNENTNRPAESHVVFVKKERDGKHLVGLEFVNPDANFWKMTFPAPGARPLRRPTGSKVSA